MRTLALTENVTIDGSIEMLGDWFDPQGQGDVENSDLLDELHRQGDPSSPATSNCGVRGRSIRRLAPGRRRSVCAPCHAHRRLLCATSHSGCGGPHVAGRITHTSHEQASPIACGQEH